MDHSQQPGLALNARTLYVHMRVYLRMCGFPPLWCYCELRQNDLLAGSFLLGEQTTNSCVSQL